MPIEVTQLKVQDIPGAILCIQEAFKDDPYFQWVFDQTKFSKERNVASLRTRCLWGINNALFYVAKDVPAEGEDASKRTNQDASPVVGVSMWLPPRPLSEPESWYSYFQSWLLSARQLYANLRYMGRGGLNIKRYKIWKACQAKAQGELWSDRRGYYFCNIVAVSLEKHGLGIGRKLFEIVTDRADKEGMKCYLESSKSVPNVEIYRRMGFELAKEIECEDSGEVCKLYCMTREPKHFS